MGFYNVLKIRTKCSNCNNEVLLNLQFYFGHTRMLEYNIGDKIAWGGNDRGQMNCKKVALLTFSEGCPICNFEDNYLVYLEKDRIISAEKFTGQFDFSNNDDYFNVVEE